MADSLTHLTQRSGDDWLLGCDSQTFFALANRVFEEVRSRPQSECPLTILLAEHDPLIFLAHFIAACAANCRIVLANPDWAQAEWQQVFALVQPDLIWGDRALEQWKTAETQRRRDLIQNSKLSSEAAQSATQNSPPLPTPDSRLPTPHSPLPIPHILIPTGGTSGNIRFAIHTWETLMASVDGFCQYFGVEQVNSFCVLPLYHVSGLMQFLRSFTTGGRLVVLPFKAVEGGDRRDLNPEEFFLSLVPTQLQRLLDKEDEELTAETQRRGETSCTQNSNLSSAAARSATQNASIVWLSRFHTVLLGGAPAWSELLEQARHHRIRLAPTYGMTETASQIATLKPDDFLNGHISAGQVLPHAQITIRDSSGEVLPPPRMGAITIQSKSLAIGYHPPFPHSPLPTPHSPLPTPHSPLPTPHSLQPDDLGFFDTNGYLHIIGRQSDKIITGGENVFPAEVEAAVRSTNLVHDVCVIGVSDRYWGQAITAVYVPLHTNTATATIQTALEDKLSKFKQPKHWLAVDQLPRNAQGKVNRSHVATIAKQALSIAPAIE